MPRPHLTTEVQEAIFTLQSFAKQQTKAKKDAALIRKSDWHTVSDSPENDRTRYYDTNIKALRNVLNGFAVELNNGEHVEGLKLT
jgi:hypothetical protein